jgi:hypothetical protein
LGLPRFRRHSVLGVQVFRPGDPHGEVAREPVAPCGGASGECDREAGRVAGETAFDTAAATELENDNYRYYIATGSTHTGFGNPRVYYDTTGGVPPLVDWLNAMIDDDPSWTNVEADPFNVLFPGQCSPGSENPGDRCNLNVDCPGGSCVGDDVKPDPLEPPFELVGSGLNADVVVSCEE